MITTGIRGLDRIITGLKAGDNVVWQIDDVKDYMDILKPFVEKALEDNKRVVYIRFASHQELVPESDKVKRYNLDAYAGFESFTAKINNIISKEGEGVYYVFDCLSELLSAWATDLMIGNFFMVTCPYLYELKTIAYFSILRNQHSFKSIAKIRETTQLLMDLYCESGCYIHPLKVWNRYSPTMFLPHLKEGDDCSPITDSVNAVKILSYIRDQGMDVAKRNLDYWDRLFFEAEELLNIDSDKNRLKDMFNKLCNIMITKNDKILALAKNNFSLSDLIEIKSKLIGSGFIGGKTVGMLLARKILSKDSSFNWELLSEPHDSFYIGSDIFYSYIVENNLWKLRMQQKTEDGYLRIAEILKEKMLYGVFPEEIKEHFQQIIEYFGSSPIIVRSSSLLEDGFGNAFAGKYESIFLANQGTPEQRYIQFAEAVKKVYASTMSEDALVYRKQRGLDKLDEQMALLVQRVSGSEHKNYFFPDLAGVGISYNTYVWNNEIDPEAGMLRLVFGLGTRAVNRVEGDYPRIVAIDDPLRKPYAEEDLKRFSQHKVDLIDIRNNNLETCDFNKLIKDSAYPHIKSIAIEDCLTIRNPSDGKSKKKNSWVLTFDRLLKEQDIIGSFKKILSSLQKFYNYPVEIEFTINLRDNNTFKINLLQCRPLQTKGLGSKVKMPSKVESNRLFFESNGYFLGGNISQRIDKIIYVDPEGYSKLALQEKYEVARIVGRLNKSIEDRYNTPTLLAGPGRWGTTTPSLGIPVSFAEINNVAVLAEIAFSAGNLMPELSFGTHFFQDLVETNIFYVALFPEKDGVYLNDNLLKDKNNMLLKYMPESVQYKDVVKFYDLKGSSLKIVSDVLTQKVICFVDSNKAKR
ncbi:MAG: PEP/pyruvate-binding domain-containing protein [Candidatus Kaelpia aquatica]|nr:PEP/pyruvate-binding domain-containing protein [Candidatus Kaelpia aquatica]